jgi:predicted PolB exonuclease-like 3'-5' exonuclease
MKKLYLDIETIPAGGNNLSKLKELYESKKKKYEDIGLKFSKKFTEFVSQTNFSGSFGRILCIAYAINDDEVEILTGSEEKILENFWHIAKDADLFIGHNVMDFDLRIIYQRSMVYCVKPSRDLSFARYRNNPIFDTLREWQKWGGNGGYDSLDALAKAFDMPSSKDGIDGSLVYKFYQENKLDEIYKYCKADVVLTRKVYKRISFTN